MLFAPMYVYSQINPGRDQGVDAGAYAVDALNLAIDQGIDTAQDYSQGDFDYMDLPTKAERSNAARYKWQLFKEYEVLFANENGGGGPDLTAALKLAISQYRPVAIGMVLRPGFRNLSRSNTIDRDTTGALSGGHEVLAVGYNSDGLIVENHWGPKWGSNGYGVVAWNVVEHDVLEAVIAD
ncbi:C1 family peptidase [Xanthomonas theicola]|uniref:C1 family peptidase n=1 Tax=Xanthomonas theicola TaxID=56464 RepID=UPI003612C153